MAHEDPGHPGREARGPDENRRESDPDSADPMTIATTDPAIEAAAEHPGDWKAHPDRTLRVETTQLGEPQPLYIQGARTVVVEDRPPAREDDRGGGERHEPDEKRARPQAGERKDRDRGDRDRGDRAERDHDRDRDRHRHHDDRPDRRPQPSTMRNLLVTAGVALLCGVIGAVGYSYFFESRDRQSGDSSRSQGKTASAKPKNASSAGKSGGGGTSKDSGQQSNAQASNSSAIPGFTSADDADTLKKQIVDLMQRVDRLGERVDRMTRPKDETPPVLRTMQIKMGELAREMDEVSSLPARLRHDENRLETLQEDIRAIRVRLESMPGAAATATARMSPGLSIPPGSTASGPSGDSRDPSNPTMDLGISLLERGQFASAREVFLRLQVAQPDDARVWYLSALAEGLTKDDWTGEARRLADRGLECERAGHPDTARIDVALATTTPIKGQDWLASLRRRVLGAGNAAGAGGK